MSFERRPKVKNRDYKVAVSVLQHPNRRLRPNRIFSENKKQLASILDGLLLMLVF